MRLRTLLTAALVPLCLAAAAHAASESATTVRGKLTVGCFKSGKGKYDGQYRYLLNGKPIAKLTSGCALGAATAHIGIAGTYASPGSTTVAVFEGLNDYSDYEKLIYIPKSGPASYVDTISMSESPGVTRKSPTAFRMEVPTGGYAVDANHLSHWTCLIDVDFAAGTARGRAETPHEKGLYAGVCKTNVVKVPI
jgi:hypothetical protein